MTTQFNLNSVVTTKLLYAVGIKNVLIYVININKIRLVFTYIAAKKFIE